MRYFVDWKLTLLLLTESSEEPLPNSQTKPGATSTIFIAPYA